MFDKLYKTESGEHRKYGIYAPGLDRFLLIDSNDMWVTLQTAELISSKIPTVAYILNDLAQGITDENCINYSILNKTNQRICDISITVAQQLPKLILLEDDGLIESAGLPEDFTSNEKKAALENLQAYTRYVHRLSYIINLQEAIGNHFDKRTFSEKYLPLEWRENLYLAGDRANKETGIFKKLRQVIYLSPSIDDLNIAMKDVWIEYVIEQGPMMAMFYKLLGQPVPEELKDKTTWTCATASFL